LLTGQPDLVRFDRVAGPAPAAGPMPPSAAGRRKEIMQVPLFRRAAQVLAAHRVADDPGSSPAARPAPAPKRAEPDAREDAPIPDPQEDEP